MAIKKNQYFPQIAFHPGETLSDKLEEMGMSIKEFALRSGKPEKTIHAVINGNSSVTADMSVAFETVLKIPANFWMNLQRSYDEFVAREERKKILEDSYEWARKFPYAEMVKKGWLSSKTQIAEKTEELLKFFSFSNFKAWEDYYFNQELKLSFRISLSHSKEPFAVSAWLRRGELQSAEIEAAVYSEKKLKEVLPQLKKLMADHPENFFKSLQEKCLQAGVKVVYTPFINKAPVNGCTRWINDSPLIQLSGRYQNNGSFWFTFFHEVGHILLHGKKEIFLENLTYSDINLEKEAEADDFAVQWTLTKAEENEIIQKEAMTVSDIVDFAKKFKTHPGIIIGRLHHKKLLHFSVGREFLELIELGEKK
jgi:addiction module HigA family antidote